ncbi:Bug family tripartite tricarboxylate transporter substrate binding protein [Muricoccus radiodurans]|uniref:Bug family tripartite tricarboxylate transporter substrate binding protein n=1 Tax=Muricoccus radiodurans TaxID=2231721 RepID=UPI003CF69B62
MQRRGLLAGVLPGLVLPGLVSRPAWAQEDYPARAIRVVLGQSPGGSNDTTLRVIGPRMTRALGQTVVIENRPGAGSNVATDQVVRSIPDGYTLLGGTVGGMTVNPTLFGNLPFDPLTDLTPISITVNVLNVLVVPSSRPWHSVQDLIAAARARPEQLSYGSSGVGGAGHLGGALLDQMAGIRTTHVPYRGGGPQMNDLLAGRMDFSFASAPTALPHIASGRLRALAVPTPQRSDLLPDVPTVAESGGLPGYQVANWYALLGPARLPAAIVDRLNAAVRAALTDPEVTQILAGHGLEPTPSSPEELGRFMREETEKWAGIIRASGAQPG